MLRAKVWGPIAIVASTGLLWQSLELIAKRPDLRPWVVFLLLLAASTVSSTLYAVGARMDRIAKCELSARAHAEADILAFDRAERKRH